MPYTEGKFYVIQARDSHDRWFFVESVSKTNEHRERLKSIARKSGRSVGTYNPMSQLDEYFDSNDVSIRSDPSPFNVRMFSMDTDMSLITSHMRHIRNACGREGLDPSSVRLAVFASHTNVFVPESQSNDEVELRKFALEKLSETEKELLNVKHWEVYHKLADRSMLEDEDPE